MNLFRFCILLFFLIRFSAGCNSDHSTLSEDLPGFSDPNHLLNILDPKNDLHIDSLVASVDSSFRSKNSRIRSRNLTQEQVNILTNTSEWKSKKLEILRAYFADVQGIEFLISPSARYDSILMYEIKDITPHETNKKVYALFTGNPWMSWGNDFYLIIEKTDGWQSLGPVHNFHRYGEKLFSFINENEDIIICFTENFGSGSGIWQHNYFFYKVGENSIRPVLNWLYRSNLQWPHFRNFKFESSIKSTSPLAILVRYQNQILYRPQNNCDSLLPERLNLLSDSTLVAFIWNERTHSYDEKNDRSITREDIPGYYITGKADVQFVRSNAAYFRTILETEQKNDTICMISQYVYDISEWLNE